MRWGRCVPSGDPSCHGPRRTHPRRILIPAAAPRHPHCKYAVARRRKTHYGRQAARTAAVCRASSMMADLVFFYGTLMTPFNRTGRRGLDEHLEYQGRGTIEAALFDLGIYPAAVPADDGRVWGEVYQMTHPVIVLRALDEIEGYSPGEPESSLYRRKRTTVTMEDGAVVYASAYFYNAPLGRAERIASGDYLQHLRVRD